MILEICVTNLESALIAQKAGANRLELCVDQEVGGVSPPIELMQQIKKQIQIPVHVLIRPRAGDFVYSNSEIEEIYNAIDHCKELGFEGIVVGALNSDDSVDVPLMKSIIQQAKDLSITYHRAFDQIIRKQFALQQLEDLGVDRLLTSGGSGKAIEFLDRLHELRLASDSIVVMPGGGLRSKNISEFLELGFTEFHSSALLGNGEPSDLCSNKEIAEMLDTMGRFSNNL